MPRKLRNLSFVGLLLFSAGPLSANDDKTMDTQPDDASYQNELSELSELDGYDYDDKEGYEDEGYDEEGYEDEDEPFEWDISLGLAYSISQTPYVGGKQSSDVMPYLNISWGPLYFDGDSFGSYLYGEDNWGISASLNSGILNDSERGGSDRLSDMTPLDDVVTASIRYEIEAQWGAVEATVSGDVSDKHNGYMANMAYSYPVYLVQWSLMPFVGAQWFNRNVSQYYYGVNDADSTATRAAYSAGSGINYSVGLGAEYEMDDHSSLSFSLETTRYSNQIRRSSIVDQSHTTSLGLAYSYFF
jgi:outer membrane protein